MKKEEKKKMEEMHQYKVEQMIKSADGSARLLHGITKPMILLCNSVLAVFVGVLFTDIEKKITTQIIPFSMCVRICTCCLRGCSVYILVGEWKDCEELMPKPKEK